MSDQNNLPVNPDTNSQPQSANCAHSRSHRGGLLRAALYTPVVLLLSGLAALATFPELANYAAPMMGDSTSCSSGGCPIAALASFLTGHQSQEQAPASCCSMGQSRATALLSTETSGGCCMGTSSCPSAAAESSATAEEPVSVPLTSTESLPLDATLVANDVIAETASN